MLNMLQIQDFSISGCSSLLVLLSGPAKLVVKVGKLLQESLVHLWCCSSDPEWLTWHWYWIKWKSETIDTGAAGANQALQQLSGFCFVAEENPMDGDNADDAMLELWVVQKWQFIRIN